MNIPSAQAPDKGFKALADIAYAEAGLVLVPEKATMIRSRLRHRLKALMLRNIEDYCAFILSPSGEPEKRHFISALTTNVSSFFRESHHFEYLTQHCAASMKTTLQNGGGVRLWSAGCSSGQEPYSIAMSLAHSDPIFMTGDFKILATDVDPAVIRTARLGRYPSDKARDIPTVLQDSFLHRTPNSDVEVVAVIRNMITFKELNLIKNWPMQRAFDVIFCRNVVIYFDTTTQNALWPRFLNALKPNGTMFVGHSERITHPSFTSIGATTYVKSALVGTSHYSPRTQGAQ